MYAALLDESSSLALAEAIARKIGYDRIPDPVFSQGVCRFLPSDFNINSKKNM
jgi:hypothetical protein